MADREPQRAADRPSGDMTDSRRTDRIDHASHDLDVLAAGADRSVDDATRMAAERQVAACRECAALFADLRLISTVLRELPRELAVTRDFRISPERAAKLRPAGWRGLLQGLLGSGPSLRPFASALTTLGVAGLILTVALPGALNGLGSATGAAAPELSSGGQPVPTSREAFGQNDGGGKSNSAASPALGPVGPPVGAGASPAVDRGLGGSFAPYPSPGSAEYHAPGSSAVPAVVTDSSGSPRTDIQAARFPTLGVFAAVSLGVLLLGLFLLIRSRARPFDSAG